MFGWLNEEYSYDATFVTKSILMRKNYKLKKLI